jgi:hypothetical protein
MSTPINEWLQDALIDFLRDWVRDRVVPELHPESADSYVSTELENATASAIRVSWNYRRPDSTDTWRTGSEWFTPRDALALFLQHGPTDGVKP